MNNVSVFYRKPVYRPPCVGWVRRSTGPAGCEWQKMAWLAAVWVPTRGRGMWGERRLATRCSYAATTSMSAFCPASSSWKHSHKVGTFFSNFWFHVDLFTLLTSFACNICSSKSFACMLMKNFYPCVDKKVLPVCWLKNNYACVLIKAQCIMFDQFCLCVDQKVPPVCW